MTTFAKFTLGEFRPVESHSGARENIIAGRGVYTPEPMEQAPIFSPFSLPFPYPSLPSLLLSPNPSLSPFPNPFIPYVLITVRRSALHGLWDRNSVRLSVCLSVTRVDCVHMV